MQPKILVAIGFAALLSGCATNFSLIDKSDGSVDGNAIVEINITGKQTASVTLDGKVYEGQWGQKGCTQEACSKYETMNSRHNRHSTLNKAELIAKNGGRLNCEWVSHLGKVTGACVDEKSKGYRIEKQN